jgi:hypothetical protein
MPIVGQFGSLAGFGVFPGGALESIATVTLSAATQTITLSSIPSGYQHLQIRFLARSSGSADRSLLRFNSDSGSNYKGHYLYGSGAAASAGVSGVDQTYIESAIVPTSSKTASVFCGAIIDVLDYASTTKNKTVRILTGGDYNGSGDIVLYSGLWMSTSAIDAISLIANAGANFAQYTTAALYGVRA